MSDLNFDRSVLPPNMYKSLGIIFDDASQGERAVLVAVDSILSAVLYATIKDDEDLAVNIAALFDHRFNAFVVEAVEAVRIELYG